MTLTRFWFPSCKRVLCLNWRAIATTSFSVEHTLLQYTPQLVMNVYTSFTLFVTLIQVTHLNKKTDAKIFPRTLDFQHSFSKDYTPEKGNVQP